jgi:uncharacterized protein
MSAPRWACGMELVQRVTRRKALWGVAIRAAGMLGLSGLAAGQGKTPAFRVVALAEKGGIHKPFVAAAKVWLGKLSSEKNFKVDHIADTEKINDAFLANYQLFIQLNYPRQDCRRKDSFTKTN